MVRPSILGLPFLLLATSVACTPDPADTQEPGLDTGETMDGPIGRCQHRLHESIGSLVYVAWTQAVDGTTQVQYRVADEDWRVRDLGERSAGPQEEVLLLGLPYGAEVEWFVAIQTEEGKVAGSVQSLATDAVPDGLPIPDVLVSVPESWEPTGHYLLGSVNGQEGGWTQGNYWKFILDREGRPVWAMLTPDRHWTVSMRPALAGDAILWDEATYWADWDQGAASRVHRMKIDGTVLESVDTPGLHHAFAERSDGRLAWGAASGNTESLLQEGLDGPEELWSCTAFHDAVGSFSPCQSNGLSWHEPTDTFLFSFYTTETVVEVDGVTGATLRHFGALPGAWGFDPEESQFWWQHAPSWTDAGTLLISTHTTEGEDEIGVREYQPDAEAEVLREVWHVGVGEGLRGQTAGEAHRLPSGNTLQNTGSGSRLREITPDGTVVWDLQWPADPERGRLLGRTELLEDLYALAP